MTAVARALKRLLPRRVFEALWSVARRLLPAAERIVWGGRTRERLLTWLLAKHYGSVSRRQWLYVAGPEDAPHFTDHRTGSYGFAFGTTSAEAFSRGFYAAEVIRPGDRLLDIGCGDGFFDLRFFHPRCESIDAVDIEPSAIEQARRYSAAPSIAYYLLDAVKEPFPGDSYDVVVWDGAIGHFAPETTEHMLRKIRATLAEDGVFVGSESLGREEGHDHLQFFDTLDDLGAVLRGEFEYVELRRIAYPIGDGKLREEALWRCAARPERLDALSWRAA